MPLVSTRSLIETGTPWRGPRSSRGRRMAAASASRAASRAWSAATVTNAFTTGLTRSIRVAEEGQREPGDGGPALPRRRKRVELGLALVGERRVPERDLATAEALHIRPLRRRSVDQRGPDRSEPDRKRPGVDLGRLRADPFEQAAPRLEQVIEEMGEVDR